MNKLPYILAEFIIGSLMLIFAFLATDPVAVCLYGLAAAFAFGFMTAIILDKPWPPSS